MERKRQRDMEKVTAILFESIGVQFINAVLYICIIANNQSALCLFDCYP